MTDKELLELAAKAAGLVIHTWEEDHFLVDENNGIGFCFYWNPLTDDGDALRLAVHLNIDINFTESLVDCGIAICKDNDPYAATRRAIVRAAAEIGKGMNHAEL